MSKQYTNDMECNIKEEQLKMDSDKNISLSLINVNIQEIFYLTYYEVSNINKCSVMIIGCT